MPGTQGGSMGSALHVGNLDPFITDDELFAKFVNHGIVESATVTRDIQTGLSKRVAYVVMANDEEAQAAINWLHLSQFEGRIISVTRIVEH
jgi:RNA recognition motif-containing protein